MKAPLLSILVPTYNRTDTLDVCLESIVHQKHVDKVEVIVSNDASTDGTRDYLENFRQRHAFVYPHHQKTNLRAAKNWEFLLNQARGDYVYMLCDDDAIAPNFLEKYFSVFEKHPDCDLVFSQIQLMNPMFEAVGLQKLSDKPGLADGVIRVKDQLLSHHMVMSSIYRRSVLHSAGGWDSQVGSHLDCTAFCRVALRSRKTFFIDQPLLLFRITPLSWGSFGVGKERDKALWYRKKIDLLKEDAKELAPSLIPFLNEMYEWHAKQALLPLESQFELGQISAKELRKLVQIINEVFPGTILTKDALKLIFSSYAGLAWLKSIRKLTGRRAPPPSDFFLWSGNSNHK